MPPLVPNALGDFRQRILRPLGYGSPPGVTGNPRNPRLVSRGWVRPCSGGSDRWLSCEPQDPESPRWPGHLPCPLQAPPWWLDEPKALAATCPGLSQGRPTCPSAAKTKGSPLGRGVRPWLSLPSPGISAFALSSLS